MVVWSVSPSIFDPLTAKVLQKRRNTKIEKKSRVFESHNETPAANTDRGELCELWCVCWCEGSDNMDGVRPVIGKLSFAMRRTDAQMRCLRAYMRVCVYGNRHAWSGP